MTLPPTAIPDRERRCSSLVRGWRAAMAALPPGWQIQEITRVADDGWKRWAAIATPQGYPRTSGECAEGEGANPGEALLALARRLSTRAARRR
jgi:hypothetical protein